MEKSLDLDLQIIAQKLVLKFQSDRSNGSWDISNRKKCWRQQFLGQKSAKNGSTAKFFREMKTLIPT